MIIDKGSWHIDAEAPPFKERARLHFADRWTVLLDWMRVEQLLADPALGRDVTDWSGFEVRDTHFTPEGMKLVKLCIATWNPAFGQGATQRHLVQWKRKLEALREEAPNQPPEPTSGLAPRHGHLKR